MPALHTPEKGLNGWVHVVYAGTHTDKNGNVVTVTQADLDDIVKNHTPVPHVIGHPQENHPAYAWTQEVKREGDDLFVKSSDINADFSNAVKNKAFPNRSASLIKTDKGWKLRHIGWLGAVPPALEKLHSAQFAAPAGVSFEFGADVDSEQNLELEFSAYDAGAAVGSIGRLFQSVRDYMIDKFGLDDADKAIPTWELEHIQQKASTLKAEDSPNSSFSTHQPPNPLKPKEDEDSMTTFTQEQLDAATAKAKEEAKAEFAKKQTELEADLQAEKDKQRQAEFSATADKLIADCKLRPADKDAWVAFAMQCEHTTNVVEFSSSNGSEKKEQTAAGWFVEFSNSVTPFLKNKDQADADATPVDFSAKAAAKACELNISVSEAMAIVKREAGE